MLYALTITTEIVKTTTLSSNPPTYLCKHTNIRTHHLTSTPPFQPSTFSTRGSDHSFTTATNRSQSRDDQLTAVELRERDKRLQQFLGRQQQSSLRLQQHLEKLRSASTPKFRPDLCRKSLQMSEQHFKGSLEQTTNHTNLHLI